ncbi:hypothetical protein CKO51_12730 [Rhodopirellula sp. SM50]|nr:hypothetical protein [Rhodopirellula sp. SM50]PAY19215.1 hypothetical protein CKO51_12730 [Rhodopirellula sp. SM50]
MSLEPTEWNVIVAGRWNKAILTPAGVAERLFGLQKGTPVEVLVALDQLLPHKIKHDGIVVTPDDLRLEAAPQVFTYANLEKAIETARRAVEELPKTPLEAVGINVRYSTIEPLGDLDGITSSEFDDKLSDASLEIVGRSHARSISWNDGRVNLFVSMDENNKFQIVFNFERKSKDKDELIRWLKTPISEIESLIEQLLRDYLGITPMEMNYDSGSE